MGLIMNKMMIVLITMLVFVVVLMIVIVCSWQFRGNANNFMKAGDCEKVCRDSETGIVIVTFVSL